MKPTPQLRVLLFIITIVASVFALGCKSSEPVIHAINGFSEQANAELADFFHRTHTHEGRKVAVFDGDGTVIGQAPHYLADECMYEYALRHAEQRPGLIAEMKTQSNVSLPYVEGRVRYLAGMTLDDMRAMGTDCFRRMYQNKIYPPMRELIDLLKSNGFEVWIVTASPEAMYQGFLSESFGIPLTNIVGVKSVIRNGVVTDEIIPPVPQDEGKKLAIETFVQERPLLVGGNSRGDKEMIEFSRDLKLIVNPDEHVAPDQDMSMADYAKQHGWLIVRVADVNELDHPALSSKLFGIRLNKEHPPAP